MFDNIFELWKYIILGLIQGITEPLPISSSGHTILFEHFFNHLNIDINFLIFLNCGSLIAIIIYYRHFIGELLKNSFNFLFKKRKDCYDSFCYLIYLLLATIPAGIAGIFLKDFIDGTLRSVVVVAFCLFITGCLLLFTQKKADMACGDLSFYSCLMMGFGQVLGLIPGISRSGVTTAFGVGSNVDLKKALRFSFLMYIPISVGAMIWSISDFSLNIEILPGMLCGLLASLGGTLLSLKMFWGIVKKNNLKYFGFYCIIIAIIVLIFC